jgi:succinoglycan biosynthesis protein ExoA
MPQVSVIIPVRNEAQHIRQTLLGLLRQDLDPNEFELLVIDGQSEDETVAIVREMQPAFRNLKLMLNPRRLSSAARNIGVRHAAGKYTVVIDGHCAVENPYYLSNLVKAFEQSGAACLGRPQPLRARTETPFQEAVATARESWLGHNPDSSIYSDQEKFVEPQNVAAAYRREVYERVGLFDERFDACEDVEFNTRIGQAGMSCFFTPSIRLPYAPRSSLRSLFHQMFRYGLGRAKLASKHPVTMTLPSLVPPLWLVWVVTTICLSLVSNWVAVAFCATLLLYFAAILGETYRLGRKSPPRSILWIPLVFVAIHIGFGWGYLRGTIRSWLST